MSAERLGRLRERFKEVEADALLVTRPANVRYLSGFGTPADARVFLTPEDALLVTDGRYIAQAKEESRLQADIVAASTLWLSRVKELVQGKTLAVEADHLTLEQFEMLREGAEIVPTKGWVGELRLIKTPEEQDKLRRAARIADDAFAYILSVLSPGVSEVEVALELEAFMRRMGAEGKAFDITVASGYRSSMPHGTASPKLIEGGELVTLDFGASVEGYRSDMTRTVALGEVGERARAIYAAVLEAEEAALQAVKPGADGKAIDALAREVLARHGLAEHFSHSLGHGVGLEIHENPSLSFRGSFILQPGMSATIEPGVYLPGDIGVRIEDLVLVSEGGYELLSQSPKHLIRL